MDIVELVKEKLGSVIFGDVSITVGGDTSMFIVVIV